MNSGPIFGQSASKRTLWIIWSTASVLFTLLVGVVSWIWLPRWQPYWVIDHSPWLNPVVRAVAHELESATDPGYIYFPLSDHLERVEKWGPACWPELTKILDSSDTYCRLAALHLMLRMPDGYIPSYLAPKLTQLVVHEKFPPGRRTAYLALRKIEHLTTDQRMIAVDGVRDPDPLVRKAAVLLIGSYEEPTSDLEFTLLRTCFQDTDDEVRFCTAQRVALLGGQTAERVKAELTEATLHDSFVDVRQQSLSALFWVIHKNQHEADEIRARLINDKSPGMAYHTLDLLVMHYPDRMTDFVIEALDSSRPATRWYACWLLRKNWSPILRSTLIERLTDADPWVAGQAALTLATHGDATVIEPLLRCLASKHEWGFNRDNPYATQRLSQTKLYWSDFASAVDKLAFTDEQRQRWGNFRQP